MTLQGTADFPPFTPPDRRLLKGLALSAGMHLLIVLGITAGPPRIMPSVPLQVELLRIVSPEPAVEPAPEPLVELTATASAEAMPETPPSGPERPPVVTPQAPVASDPPLEKYLTVREVDVRAELVNEVDLVYPVKAYEMRIHGRVIVRILIGEDGAVDNVSVLEATPPGIFEEAALAAAQALQFRPAQKYGRNVRSQKTIEITFDPYESIRRR